MKPTARGINKKKGSIRGKYSPGKLQKALNQIVEDGIPISTVSRNFNIPRTTLLYKSNGKRPRIPKKPGPEPMLGKEAEEELECWVKTILKNGFPLTKESLCYSASTLLNQGHGKLVNTYNKDKGPGRRWFESFMKRIY